MGDFKGVTEKFSVDLVSDDGYGSQRVRCEVGLEGVVLSTPDGYRVLRKYALNHISRWVLQGSSLVLYTKTNSDIEEHCLTLQGDQRTITSLLDTLTCSCMQMAELLQSQEQTSKTTEVVNSLNQLLRPDPKKPQLKAMEEVEFWSNPEKTGWMYSQGEVIKSWRKRWFVLKEGFLFRFASPDVTSASKARGFVDMSKVTDVSEAREQTGKGNSLKLSTESGHVLYLTDSETDLVEWISALEGSVSAIVRKIAGMEAEPAPQQKSTGGSDWTRQLEKVYSSAGGSDNRRSNHNSSNNYGSSSNNYGGSSNYGSTNNKSSPYGGYDAPSRPSSGFGRSDSGGYGRVDNDRYGRSDSGYGRNDSRDRNQMVRVVGYDTPSSNNPPQRQTSDFNYGGLRPSDISGVAGVVPQSSNEGAFSDSFSRPQEYPAYPVLAPTGSANNGLSASAPHQDYNSSNQHNSYSQAPSSNSYNSQPQSYGYSANGQSSYQPSPPPQQQQSKWQVHYTNDGRPYYHDPSTGVTQWDQPAGMA